MHPWKVAAFGLVACLVLLAGFGCSSPGGGTSRPTSQIDVYDAARHYVSGDTLDWGSTTVGAPRELLITVANRGDGTLVLSGTPVGSVLGTDAAYFTVTTPPPASVPARQEASMSVRFSPDAARAYQATLTLTTNDENAKELTLFLRGQATPAPQPEIEISGPSGSIIADGTGEHVFAATLLGSMTDATFTIRNIGTGDLTLGGSPVVLLDGADATCFTVTGPDPATPVSPSGSSTFTMRFTPGASRAHEARVIIFNTDADESTFDFRLSGLGISPEIEVRKGSTVLIDGTGSYSFASTVVGGSTQVDFSIFNSGTAPLHLTGASRVALGGSDAGQFEVLVQPASPVAVSTGQCDFRVAFRPTSAGAKSAEVAIENDDLDENPYTFFISGTALEAPPPTPGSFRVFWVTASQVQLAWDAADRAASYHVQQSATGTSGWSDAPGGDAVTTTSYTHTGLSTGVTVYYRVCAVNPGGSSAWSATISATTGTFTAPSSPAVVTANNAMNPAALQWISPATWGAGVGPNTFTLEIDGVTVASGLSSTVTSYTLSLSIASGVHSFRVIASNGSLSTPSETRTFFIVR